VCKVYIAASGRRILPHRSGGRGRLACAQEIGQCQIFPLCARLNELKRRPNTDAIFRLTRF